MLRRLLRVAAAGSCLLSLLACLGLGWLWWRSYQMRGVRELDWRGVRWEVASHRGRASLDNGPQRRLEDKPLRDAERRHTLAYARREALWSDDHFPRDPDQPFREWEAAVREEADTRLQYIGAMAESQRRPRAPAAEYTLPHYGPAAAAGLPPLLWLTARGRRRWVHRRRERLGLCRHCGYDLRGSPPGRRCSECGAARSPVAGPDAQHGRAAGV